MSKVNELLFKIRANGSPGQVVLAAAMEERGEKKTDSACVRGLTWMFLLICWRKSWDVGSCHSPGLEAALLGSVSLSPWKHQEQQAWITKAFPWLFLHPSHVHDKNPWLSPHSPSLGAAKNQLCLHNWDLTSHLWLFNPDNLEVCRHNMERQVFGRWSSAEEVEIFLLAETFFFLFQIDVLNTEMVTSFFAVQMTWNFH